jgi:hypothetical protein
MFPGFEVTVYDVAVAPKVDGVKVTEAFAPSEPAVAVPINGAVGTATLELPIANGPLLPVFKLLKAITKSPIHMR